MKGIRLFTAALLAALILGIGAAGAEQLKIGHSTWVGYGPLFIARDKGFFKEEGVEVELVNMEDVKIRAAALVAGKLDAMATTVDTVLLYLKPNVKLVYLFALDDSKGGDGIVANKDIKSIADLKGKKVAFTEGSVSQFYINVLLKKAGLSQADIEIVNMTAGDAGSAFVTGKVDAAVTWEPWLSRGKATDHGHLLADSSTTPGLITDIITASPETVASRQDEFRALYRGWVRAVEFAKTNPDEANAIMAKGVGGWLKDPAVFADTLSGIAFYDGKMNKAFVGTAAAPGGLATTAQNAIDIWTGFGKMQTKVTAGELIDHGIVNQ